jgi:nicotinate-nucleotide adenylyltransferase
MGGTFDPIHNGHLMLGAEAYKAYQLDQIWFMPNGIPPHKNLSTIESNIEQRIEMVRLAIAEHKEYRIETYEADRRETSYTYSTMEYFIEKYPDDEFFFIIGADSLFAIDTWVHPERIFPTCTILAAYRDEIDTASEMIARIQELEKRYEDVRIELMYTPLIHVSSHELRQKVKSGLDIRAEVPEVVARYIEEHQLYR